jgi:hypothetical protein
MVQIFEPVPTRWSSELNIACDCVGVRLRRFDVGKIEMMPTLEQGGGRTPPAIKAMSKSALVQDFLHEGFWFYFWAFCSGTRFPSASILRTSPRFSSRMPLSTLLMSPTMTQIRCLGRM